MLNCINCEEFIENLHAKSCKICSKEFPYCFGKKLCYKVTKGSIEIFKYEYLTCGECDYLGVRYTYCGKLCKIYASKAGLFWSCSNHDFYKQRVIHSIKNQIKKYENIITMNEEILCSLIFRIVNEFEFIYILSNFLNSDKLSVHAIEDIKKRLSDENSKIVDIIDLDVLKLNTSTPNRDLNLNAISVNEMFNLQSLTPTPVYVSESLKDDYNLDKEIYRKDKDKLNEWQRRMEAETCMKFSQENYIALKQEMEALKICIDNKFSLLIQTQENYKQEMEMYNNQT